METTEQPVRVINHKTMRKVIGLIAIQMPVAVVLLSGRPAADLSSISISYWTTSHDIFVGSLIAVAFFLFAYNGTGACRRDIEFWLGKAACIFAIVVAFFPTTDFNDCTDCAPGWVMSLADWVSLKPHQLHYPAAILLFSCLVLMMSFFSLRAKNKGEYARANIYFTISLSMLIGMPLIYVVGEYTGWYESVFWVEFVGLLLFGIGWLVAGTYTSKPVELVSGEAEIVDRFKVDPREHNFETNIVVKEGERYFFEAKGCWKDWFMECDPNGWGPGWNPFAAKNRMKWKPMFMLCGNVGKNDKYAFAIGARGPWTVPAIDDVEPRVRKLYLFANDWENKYGNNQALAHGEGGPLEVTVYRFKSDVG